jgi:hypothetical protein
MTRGSDLNDYCRSEDVSRVETFVYYCCCYSGGRLGRGKIAVAALDLAGDDCEEVGAYA